MHLDNEFPADIGTVKNFIIFGLFVKLWEIEKQDREEWFLPFLKALGPAYADLNGVEGSFIRRFLKDADVEGLYAVAYLIVGVLRWQPTERDLHRLSATTDEVHAMYRKADGDGERRRNSTAALRVVYPFKQKESDTASPPQDQGVQPDPPPPHPSLE